MEADESFIEALGNRLPGIAPLAIELDIGEGVAAFQGGHKGMLHEGLLESCGAVPSPPLR